MAEKFVFLCPIEQRKLEWEASKYDGGYVLPEKVVLETDTLVTFGVSTNIDFETDYYSNNPKSQIIMIDPFIGITNDLMRFSKRIFGWTKPIKRHINLKKFMKRKTFFVHFILKFSSGYLTGSNFICFPCETKLSLKRKLGLLYKRKFSIC